MNSDVQLTKDVKQRIIGLLLGDGSIAKPRQPGYGARIVLRHSYKQYAYLLYKTNYLRGLGLNMSEPKPNPVTLENGKTYMVYQTQSLYYQALSKLYSKVYPGGRKTIRSTIVENMNAFDLAIWILDDGSLQMGSSSGVGKYNGIRIASESFNNNEHEILCKYLRRNFGLSPQINHKKGKPYIYFNLLDSVRIVKLCKPSFLEIGQLFYKWKAFDICNEDTRVPEDFESLTDREIITRLFLKHVLFPESDKNQDREIILKYYESLSNFEQAIKTSRIRLEVQDMTQMFK